MIIEKAKHGGYSQYRIPGIVVTANGTLLAYYECRKTNSDWADIDIKLIRSEDNGETWQTVTVFAGNGNTLNNPVTFVKEQELHLLFLKNYKQLYHCLSTDDGKTFSEPIEINFKCGFYYNAVAVGPGHGIVKDGRFIVPIWFAQNGDNERAHHPSVIATLYSDDGDKWKLGEVIGKDVLTDPSECALAITSNNKVLISIRNENTCRRRAFALSDTGIGDWGEIYFDQRFPDPICMGSMCHENGRIYHINCESSSKRENLTVKISDDCFESIKCIFIDSPAGYSDVAINNNTLYCFYERDCANGGLHFKKITV